MEATAAEWSRGMLRAGPRGAGTTGSTFYASGGAMACGRERFLELGGFDPIYFPGYHEDVDLAWRAWKRGWRCVHAPQSVVYHAGGATMGRGSASRTLMARNEFLFHWKNLDQPEWMFRHVLWLTPRLLAAAVSGRLYMIQGFMQALRHVPEVARQRQAAADTARLTDSQAFMRVNDEVTPVIVHRPETRNSAADAVEGV
jgi:GT2 family glycosyltransferase